MKKMLTLVLPTLIILTGAGALLFFEKGKYNLSAVLTLTSYLSASLWVFIINKKKPAIA